MELIKTFLELRVAYNDDPDQYHGTHRPHTYLHYAVEYGEPDLVQELIVAGYNIELRDELNSTPLYVAAQYNRLEAARILIECGADIDNRPPYKHHPIEAAAIRGNRDVMVYLLSLVKLGASPSWISLDNLLHLASLTDSLPTVKYLVEKGARVNKANNHWVTPLHNAAVTDYHTTKYLIQQGANMFVKDEDGNTPLDRATLFQFASIIELLKEKMGL
jgi:ankyrin repeat protein